MSEDLSSLQQEAAALERELEAIHTKRKIETLREQVAEAKRESKAPKLHALPNKLKVKEGEPKHVPFSVEDLEDHNEGRVTYVGPDFCAVLYLDGWVLEVSPGPPSYQEVPVFEEDETTGEEYPTGETRRVLLTPGGAGNYDLTIFAANGSEHVTEHGIALTVEEA